MKVQKFSYHDGQQLRVVAKEGSIWFVATDVCKILGLITFNALKTLADSEKDRLPSYHQSLQMNQRLYLVNRSGLAALFTQSKSTDINYFREWIYFSVIPQMNNQPIIEEKETETMDIKDLVVLNDENVPTTTSLLVAERFGKQHSHVIRKIENLECSIEFTQSNFGPSDYKDGSGKKCKMYNLTRNGFSFLVNKSSGLKEAEFTENFIGAFNAMEAELLKPKDTPFEIPKNYSDALMLAGQKQARVEQLEYEKAEDAPKVEFFDTLSTEKKLYTLTDGFKRCGLHSDNMMEWCRDHGDYLFKNHINLNEPTTRSLSQGLMVYKKNTFLGRDGYLKTTWQAYLTGDGIIYFTGLVEKGKLPFYLLLVKVNQKELELA